MTLSPQEADQRASERQRVMAKAELMREIAKRRQDEIRVGEEWNDTLKIAANRKDPEKLSGFWVEFKVRLFKKFGSMQQVLDSLYSGEAFLSYTKFNDLMQSLNLPLNSTVMRSLFDKAANGERGISMENLKAVLTERSIQALSFVVQNFKKSQMNVSAARNILLRTLIEAEPASKLGFCDRVQRKLSVKFVKDIWQELTGRSSSAVASSSTDKAKFLQVLTKFVGVHIQSHQLIYFARVFDRIADNKDGKGAVEIDHLVAALILISPETDRSKKISLLFEALDSDYDGCLMYHQILAMCRLLHSQLPLISEEKRHAEDPSFQSTISEEDGTRAYEVARWNLQRGMNLEGDLVTLPELWQAFEAAPEVLETLLPGFISMRWATEPSSQEIAAEAAQEDPHLHKDPPDHSEHHPRHSHHHGRHPNIRQAHHSQHAHVSGGVHKTKAHSAEFQTLVKSRFQKTLQRFGDERLADLMSYGHKQAEESDIFYDRPSAAEVSDWRDLVKDFLEPVAAASFAGTVASRPVSSASVKTTARRSSAAGLTRISSAPGVLVRPAVPSAASHSPSQWSQGSTDSLGLGLKGTVGDLPDLPPIFMATKWGGEALDRFRILSAAPRVSNRYRRKDDGPKVKSMADKGFGFECQVCFRQHVVSPTESF